MLFRIQVSDCEWRVHVDKMSGVRLSGERML